jgi:flagellar motility protein MotE (MotC chaperone)
LPAEITELEARQAELNARLASSDLYRSGAEDLTLLQERIRSLETELTLRYARWEELESRRI